MSKTGIGFLSQRKTFEVGKNTTAKVVGSKSALSMKKIGWYITLPKKKLHKRWSFVHAIKTTIKYRSMCDIQLQATQPFKQLGRPSNTQRKYKTQYNGLEQVDPLSQSHECNGIVFFVYYQDF